MFHSETGNLVERMLRSEPDLMPVVLDRMQGRLVLWTGSRLSKKLRARVEPEDAAQEVYVRLLRAYPDFDGTERAAFYAWMFKIARHTVADLGKYFNAKKRQSNHLDGGTRTSPSQHAARREALDVMLAAFDGLDEADRQSLSLRYLEELEYSEIGEVLDCSVGAARVRVCRALGRLRAMLVDRQGEIGRDA